MPQRAAAGRGARVGTLRVVPDGSTEICSRLELLRMRAWLLRPAGIRNVRGTRDGRRDGRADTTQGPTWKSVRLRAAACDTTTLMRCCPSSLRTSALRGFSVTWSAAAVVGQTWGGGLRATGRLVPSSGTSSHGPKESLLEAQAAREKVAPCRQLA